VAAHDTPARGGVAAAVLAGGGSRRMGRDKATLPVGGVELAGRVVAAAHGVAAPVVLVAPAPHAAAALARRLGVGLVTDPGEGPLAALAAALAALRAPHVLLLAADHPALHPGLLARLVAERGAGQAVACRRGGELEPLVAVYQREPALAVARSRLAAGGDRSLRGLLAALRTRVLDEPAWRAVDPEGASFLDLDDPADLAAFQARPGGPMGAPPDD
jgi:molybdopterin-guanine dinucleotide biosynthesis protein A